MNKSTREIRKELALLISFKQEKCSNEQQKNKAVIDARSEINRKYGRGWREQNKMYVNPYNTDYPSFYDNHIFGEHWMD